MRLFLFMEFLKFLLLCVACKFLMPIISYFYPAVEKIPLWNGMFNLAASTLNGFAYVMLAILVVIAVLLALFVMAFLLAKTCHAAIYMARFIKSRMNKK